LLGLPSIRKSRGSASNHQNSKRHGNHQSGEKTPCGTEQEVVRRQILGGVLALAGLESMEDVNKAGISNKTYMEINFTSPLRVLGWEVRGRRGPMYGPLQKRRGFVDSYVVTYVTEGNQVLVIEDPESHREEHISRGSLALPDVGTMVSLPKPVRTKSIRITPEVWSGVPYLEFKLFVCSRSSNPLSSSTAQAIAGTTGATEEISISISEDKGSVDNKAQEKKGSNNETKEDKTEKTSGDTTQNTEGSDKDGGEKDDTKGKNKKVKSTKVEIAEETKEEETIVTKGAAGGKEANAEDTSVKIEQLKKDLAESRSQTAEQAAKSAAEASSEGPKVPGASSVGSNASGAGESNVGSNAPGAGTSNEGPKSSTAEPGGKGSTGSAGEAGSQGSNDSVEEAGSEESKDVQPSHYQLTIHPHNPKCEKPTDWRYAGKPSPVDYFTARSNPQQAWRAIMGLGYTPYLFPTVVPHAHSHRLLEIVFLARTRLDGLRAAGLSEGQAKGEDSKEWGSVTRFSLMFKDAGTEKWRYYRDGNGTRRVFTMGTRTKDNAGNPAVFHLPKPLDCDAVGIFPQSWENKPYLQIDLLACYLLP
ncbi:hypothetical protein BaRGS_00039967, partial [Batillaria attramentaria]